jgi:hypothetical protein
MALYSISGTVSTTHNIVVTNPVLEINPIHIVDGTVYYKFELFVNQSAQDVHDSFEIDNITHRGSFNGASYSVVSGDAGKTYIDLFEEVSLDLVTTTLVNEGVIASSASITGPL